MEEVEFDEFTVYKHSKTNPILDRIVYLNGADSVESLLNSVPEEGLKLVYPDYLKSVSSVYSLCNPIKEAGYRLEFTDNFELVLLKAANESPDQLIDDTDTITISS